VQVIFGQLSISGLDSTLLPQNAWLLLGGFPDPEQAARAATNYIVNVKGLRDGASVAVTGVQTSVGNQLAIVMSDINASGGLEQHAPEAMAQSSAQARPARSRNKTPKTKKNR
jgi:hypothetical protein